MRPFVSFLTESLGQVLDVEEEKKVDEGKPTIIVDCWKQVV